MIIKRIISIAILTAFPFFSYCQVQAGSTLIDTFTLKNNLVIPWDLSWGPDNFIWYTERNGKITRLNPETGQTFEILSSIPDLWTDNPVPSENMASGLFGMVIHPDFSTSPHVFLYYTHHPGSPRVKIVRYTYNALQDALINPFVLIDNIEGTTTFHNSGRMVITPDRKLLLSTGDRSNQSTPQNINSLNGKILRLNLDGSVPADNPIPGNYLWSIGIRHAQGLVYSPDQSILYSSQHGAGTDDEINIIERNRNYGWPNVEGFCNTPTEQTFCIANNVKEPLFAWTPTIAPCGIDFYNADIIPEWKNALIMATLKERDLRVLKLSANGLSITAENIYFDYSQGMGRLRDVLVSPDGDVYVSTSNTDDNGDAFSPPPGIPRPDDDRIMRIANIAPRSLVVVQVTTNAATIAWKDRWNKETGIRVYRAEGLATNTYSLMATLPANTTQYTDATIINGQAYYYRVQTFNGSFTSGFSNTVTISAAVPVKFTTFTATVQKCNEVQLHWETSQEFNNKGFYIEQSSNGTTFDSKGFVPAGTNPSSAQQYAFTIPNITNGKWFLRLRQEDNDGTISYSAVASATVGCSNAVLRLRPNPAKDMLHIDGIEVQTSYVVLSVHNSSGQMVLQQEVKTNTAAIDISDLRPGVYLLRLSNGKHAKFVKE